MISMQEEIAKLVELPDVTAVTPKAILDVIEASRRKRATGLQLLRHNDILKRTKARSANVPKRGILTAVEVSEGADISEQSIPDVTYQTTTVSAVKIGTYFKITKEAIDATEIDVINDLLEDAGAAIADKEDDLIYDAILSAPTSNIQASANAGKIVFADIVKAKSKVEASNFEPDTVVLSPARADDLLVDAAAIARFVDKSELPENEQLVRQLGRLAGLDVIVSNAVPDTTVLVLDRKALGWYLPKRDVDVKRDESITTDSIEFAVFKEFGVGVTQADAVCFLTVAPA